METMINKSPIALTPSAINEVKRLMADDEFDAQNYLRIGVKGGGCSGMSYVLGFEPKTEKDELHEIEGVQYIINPSHAIYLRDMEIDWEGGLNSRGFVFKNPNASTTCGCGSSFGV